MRKRIGSSALRQKIVKPIVTGYPEKFNPFELLSELNEIASFFGVKNKVTLKKLMIGRNQVIKMAERMKRAYSRMGMTPERRTDFVYSRPLQVFVRENGRKKAVYLSAKIEDGGLSFSLYPSSFELKMNTNWKVF